MRTHTLSHMGTHTHTDTHTHTRTHTHTHTKHTHTQSTHTYTRGCCCVYAGSAGQQETLPCSTARFVSSTLTLNAWPWWVTFRHYCHMFVVDWCWDSGAWLIHVHWWLVLRFWGMSFTCPLLLGVEILGHVFYVFIGDWCWDLRACLVHVQRWLVFRYWGMFFTCL